MGVPCLGTAYYTYFAPALSNLPAPTGPHSMCNPPLMFSTVPVM
jgi:hypothetical protein